MFCQNCGAQLTEAANFCPKCGKKNIIQTENDNIDSLSINEEDNDPNNSAQIITKDVTTIPQLKDHLIALRDAPDSASALTYAVEAQLQVLEVLDSPAMTSSCFDLMIESLYKALQKTSDKKQRVELQERAAIMTKNMVFFMEAKLRYEENKNSEQGKELLNKGCSLLAESATEIITGGAKIGIKIVGRVLFQNLTKDKNFFKMFIDFFGKKERINKNNKEFDAFLLNFIGKLDRYKNIFGKSILLSELVYQYKDRLIAQYHFSEPEPPCGIIYKPSIWLKTLVLAIVLAGFAAIPVEFGLYTSRTWEKIVPLSALIAWISVNTVYIVICIISSSMEKNAYNKAVQAYDKQSEILDNYYTGIAESYNVINSDSSGSSKPLNKSITELQTALKNYERIHDLREEKKEGGKSWTSLMLLCLLLGWIGAHRFYTGKIVTGIIMVITIPTGISIIWAIIDLILIFSGKFTDNNGEVIKL